MDFKKEGFSFVDKRNMIQHKQLIRNGEAGLSLPARLRSHKTSAEAPDCTCRTGSLRRPRRPGHWAAPLSKNTTTWQAVRNSQAPRTLPPGIQPHGRQTCGISMTIRMCLVDKPADVQLWLGIRELFQNTR